MNKLKYNDFLKIIKGKNIYKITALSTQRKLRKRKRVLCCWSICIISLCYYVFVQGLAGYALPRHTPQLHRPLLPLLHPLTVQALGRLGLPLQEHPGQARPCQSVLLLCVAAAGAALFWLEQESLRLHQ